MSDEQHIQSGRDTIHAGRDVVQVAGDYVARDKITHIYQQVLRPLPVKYSALVRPLIEHYTAVFGGRDAELARLDAFLADPQHPFGLLVAPTGLGKTALLVHWIARVQQQHPQWRIIFAPVSIRYQTASEQVTLSILAHNLAEVHNDLEQFRSYDQSPSNLRALIADYLHRPLPTGTQLLIVLDGVDEAIGWTVGPLCAVTPQDGLKIVIAARQRANATRDDYRQQLDWTNVPVAQLDLQALDLPAAAALLQQSGRMLTADPAFISQFYRVSEGDPLTCNLLVKALISGKITPESLNQRPPGLEAFLKDWVETLRKRRQASRPIRELLALCAAAYGPLTSDDLQTLAPDVFVEQSDIVDAVSDDDVARFIITVGEAQHTYVFSHQRLREVFLEQIYPPKDRGRLQQRLIAYGEAWYADRNQPLPDYLRQFWITHLKEADQWDLMHQVLTEFVPLDGSTRHTQPWIAARYLAEGNYTSYLANLDVLWQWANLHKKNSLSVRCALIASSIRSLSGRLTPEIIKGLVMVGTSHGKWSVATALEHIRLASVVDMPYFEQSKVLVDLFNSELDIPGDLALEVVAAIPHDVAKFRAIRALIPKLSKELHSKALSVVKEIDVDFLRVETVAYFIPYLESQGMRFVVNETLYSARLLHSFSARANCLRMLVPYIEEELQSIVWQEIIDAACSDMNEDRIFHRGRPTSEPTTFLSLITELPYETLEYAIQSAMSIKYAGRRSNVLFRLVERLNPSEQLAKWPFVWQAAIEWRAQYHEALSKGDLLLSTQAPIVVSTHVPKNILEHELEYIDSIEDEVNRCRSLIKVAPFFSKETQQIIWQKALQAAKLIGRVDSQERAIVIHGDRSAERIESLILLASVVPICKRGSVWDDIFLEISELKDGSQKVELLASIVEQAPSDFAAKARDILRKGISNDIGVLPYLLEEDRLSIWKMNLEEALSRPIETSRVHELKKLTSVVSPDIARTALPIITSLKSKRELAVALGVFTPVLPIEEQPDYWKIALDSALVIDDHFEQSVALVNLAPTIPDDHQIGLWERIINTFEEIIPQHRRAHRDRIKILQHRRAHRDRIKILQLMLPRMPRKFLSKVVDLVCNKQDQDKLDILLMIASHVDKDERLPICIEILNEIRLRQDSISAGHINPLIELLDNIMLPLIWDDMMGIARQIEDRLLRAETLFRLNCMRDHPVNELWEEFIEVLYQAMAEEWHVSEEKLHGLILNTRENGFDEILVSCLIKVINKLRDEKPILLILREIVKFTPVQMLDQVVGIVSKKLRSCISKLTGLCLIIPLLAHEDRDNAAQELKSCLNSKIEVDERFNMLCLIANSGILGVLVSDEDTTDNIPKDEQIWKDICDLANKVSDEELVLRWLPSLINKLSDDLKSLAAETVFNILVNKDTRSYWYIDGKLDAILLYLPQKQLQILVDHFSSIRSVDQRITILKPVAVALQGTEQTKLWRKLLDDSMKMTNTERSWTTTASPDSIVPYIPSSLVDESIEMARTRLASRWRAELFIALARTFDGIEKVALWKEILSCLCAEDYNDARAHRLAEVAKELATNLNPLNDPSVIDTFNSTVRLLTTYGRPGFLSSLAALMPWVEAIATPAELSEIALSMIDVSHCWP